MKLKVFPMSFSGLRVGSRWCRWLNAITLRAPLPTRGITRMSWRARFNLCHFSSLDIGSRLTEKLLGDSLSNSKWDSWLWLSDTYATEWELGFDIDSRMTLASQVWNRRFVSFLGLTLWNNVTYAWRYGIKSSVIGSRMTEICVKQVC